jgi:hypothetical protein
MITFSDACLIQFENTLFGALVIMLSMLIGGELDRWYKIVDEDSPFRNPFFLAYMISLWVIGGPCIIWYYQVPRYGIWEPLFQINPYMGWIVRIGFSAAFIGCLYLFKRKNKFFMKEQ